MNEAAGMLAAEFLLPGNAGLTLEAWAGSEIFLGRRFDVSGFRLVANSWVNKKLYLYLNFRRSNQIRYVQEPFQGYGNTVAGIFRYLPHEKLAVGAPPHLCRPVRQGGRPQGLRIHHPAQQAHLPGQQVPLFPRRARVQRLPEKAPHRPAGLVHLYPGDRHPAGLRLALRKVPLGGERIPPRRPLPGNEARALLQGFLPLAAGYSSRPPIFGGYSGLTNSPSEEQENKECRQRQVDAGDKAIEQEAGPPLFLP